MQRKVSTCLVLLLLLSIAGPLSQGKEFGKFSSGTGCSCHYGGAATVSMSGHPTTYTAGQTYTLSLSVSGGVSGTAGGFSLDVNDGTFSTGMGIMAVKVNSNGLSATHTTANYRSWSVDWTAPATGAGQITFNLAGLTASGDGSTSGDAWGTAVYYANETGGAAPNNAPTVSNLQIGPTNPVTTDTLTLSYTYQDSDGDAESGTEIRWYKDGILESSRNDQTTVPPSLTQKGESWNVTVTPSDGDDQGNLETSSNLNIANSIPIVQSAAITPSSATEDDVLTIEWTDFDADVDTLSPSGIEWYVDESKVSAFDGEITVPSIAIRDGDIWYSKIKVNDGEIDSAWFTTANITIGSNNSAPVVTSVSLAGPYTTIDDLTATWTSSDNESDSIISSEFRWELNGVLYNGQSDETLPSSQTNKGQNWRVSCRVSDGQFSQWSDWSNSITIANSVPSLNSFTIEQESVFSLEEVTFVYDANDADEDELTTQSSWSPSSISNPLPGEIYTMEFHVIDSEGAVSISLSDSVVIANSLPEVAYDGNTTFDSSSDLSPIFSSSDANNDTVNLSIIWQRNGFSTTFEGSSIPSNNLGPGDIWTAIVTPNDGTDDGNILSVSFTISNIEPVAAVSMEQQIWIGVPTTLSSLESTDIDGIITDATWTIGNTDYNGLTIEITPDSASTSIALTVYDDSGGSNSTMATLIASNPPEASDIEVKVKATDVEISWQGTALEWAVYRDGSFLGNTEQNSWTDSPPLEGELTYSIKPVIDGIEIPISQDVSATVSADDLSETPGPALTAGMIFGILMIIVGLLGASFSFISGRD